MIKFGTNRLCIVGKEHTYKIALTLRGFLANYDEYRNYYNNKEIVARTEYHWWGLKQETLRNVITYDYLEEKVLPEHQEFLRKNIHNRIQIGQDKNGKWKFFDYEDVKFYLKAE